MVDVTVRARAPLAGIRRRMLITVGVNKVLAARAGRRDLQQQGEELPVAPGGLGDLAVGELLEHLEVELGSQLGRVARRLEDGVGVEGGGRVGSLARPREGALEETHGLLVV